MVRESCSLPTLVVGFVLIALPASAVPIQVAHVTFDAGGDAFFTDPGEFLVAPDSYFTQTDGVGIAPAYDNTDGNFFAASDVDHPANGGAFPAELRLLNLDISGLTDLSFSFDVAGAGAGWEASVDEVTVTGAIDGVSIGTLFLIQNGWFFAAAPQVFQFGVLDLGTLSSTFTNYQTSIFQTGNTLDLTVSFRLNAPTGEDFALDNLRVLGEAATPPQTAPEPATFGLVCAGLAGLGFVRRGRAT